MYDVYCQKVFTFIGLYKCLIYTFQNTSLVNFPDGYMEIYHFHSFMMMMKTFLCTVLVKY